MTEPATLAPLDPVLRDDHMDDFPIAAAGAHAHDHGHVHDHGHAHGAVGPRPVRVAPSLFRLSLGARLGLAVVLSAGLWAAVAWALTPIAGE